MNDFAAPDFMLQMNIHPLLCREIVWIHFKASVLSYRSAIHFK